MSTAVEEVNKQRSFQRPSNPPPPDAPGFFITSESLRNPFGEDTPKRVASSPRSRSPRTLSIKYKKKDKEDLFQEVTVYLTSNIKETIQQNPEKPLKKILPPICLPRGINLQRNCFFLFDGQRKKLDLNTKLKDIKVGNDGKVIYVVNLKDNQMASDWPELFAGTTLTPENGKDSKAPVKEIPLHTFETSSESSSDDQDHDNSGGYLIEKSESEKLHTAHSTSYIDRTHVESIKKHQSHESTFQKSFTTNFHTPLRPSDKTSSFLLRSPNQQQGRTSRPFIGERSNHDCPETPTRMRARNPSQGTLESTPRSPKNTKNQQVFPLSVPPRPKYAPPEVSLQWRKFPNLEEEIGFSPRFGEGSSDDEYELHDYF